MKLENKMDQFHLLHDIFDSSDDNKFLKIENSENFNLKPSEKFTVIFWLKSTEMHRGSIVAKMEHDLKEYRGWDVSIYNEKDGSMLALHLINKYPENCIKVVSSKIHELIDGHWHHVAIVYNGHVRSAGVKIFVDGNQVETRDERNSLNGDINNNHPITIGSRANGLFNFRGSLYDIRVIKAKLNQSEITKLAEEANKEILGNLFPKKIEAFHEKKALVHVENVSRVFTIHYEKNADIFSKLISISSRKDKKEKLIVLDNISLELRKGEMLGILGRNGSGKTTLLKIIGGIMQPSSGKIEINGKISSFLFLGSSFHPDLTARQNVILYGMVLGETKDAIEKKADSIIKFAELEKFADVKIRNFSTGMNMRLAFSTALAIDPDILLIDEVLAVGDLSFQQKSLQAFLKIKNSRKSIIFVSHNLDQLERFCDRLILLEKGKIVESGEPEDVISTYTKMITGIDTKNVDMSNP